MMGPLPLQIYKHQCHIPAANEASFYIIGDPPLMISGWRTRGESLLFLLKSFHRGSWNVENPHNRGIMAD